MNLTPGIASCCKQMALLGAALILAGGCTRQVTAPEAPGRIADDSTTTRYSWYMSGVVPAGHSVVVHSRDGRIGNESFIHWNNREYTLNSELRIDPAGRVIDQRITGISPFGAPIDERFSLENGTARWSTVGNQGSVPSDGSAIYLPSETAAIETLPLLVRAALQHRDGTVDLLPAGRARVERVEELRLDTGTGTTTLGLYAISGIGFTPHYVWLDEDLELVALDWGGWLGMIPEGWNPDLLGRLSEAQSLASARHHEQVARELAGRIEAPLVIENVAVVDVEHGRLLESYHVLVEDGYIAMVSERPIRRSDALRIDGTGQSLMPGLWDMHGHFSLEDGLLNIAGGITSVRDIGNVHEKIMEATALHDSGKVIGPRTYRAGFIDKTGPFAAGWPAETLEDALQRVDFFAEHGYLQVKLYSSIEPDWVAPIAARTHAHGMRVSGHIPAFMSAEQAVAAGYDEIQHINMVFLNFLAGDQADTRQQIRFTLYGDEAAKLDLDSQEVENFIRLLRDRDVVVDPTAAIFETMLVHEPGQPDPTFATVAEHLPAAVRRRLYSPEMVLGDNWPASARQQSRMLRKLYEAGVQLVPGSDHYPAFTLHRELEVYVEAGIPAASVLRMATLDSARVMGVAGETGSIAVGKEADLVLVAGNPLEDISAVRRATLVLKGDTAYRPDALYRAAGVKPFLPSVALR
jgi:hypothetical protein